MSKPDPQIGELRACDGLLFISRIYPDTDTGAPWQPCVSQWLDLEHGPGWHNVPFAAVQEDIAKLGLRLATYDKKLKLPGFKVSAVAPSDGGEYRYLEADAAAATPAPAPAAKLSTPDPAASLTAAELQAAKDRAAAAKASVQAKNSWATAAANITVEPDSAETPPVPANWTRVVAKMSSQGVKNAHD